MGSRYNYSRTLATVLAVAGSSIFSVSNTVTGSAFDASCAKAATPVKSRYSSIEKLLSSHSYPQALAKLRKLIKSKNYDILSVVALLDRAARINSIRDDVIDLIELHLKNYPKDYSGNRLLGVILSWDAESSKEAARHLEICYKQNPNDSELAEVLAQVYTWSDQVDKASQVYEKLIKDDPHNIDRQLAHAQVLSYSKESQIEALAKINKLIEVHGKSDKLLAAKANLLIWMGRPKEALSIVKNLDSQFTPAIAGSVSKENKQLPPILVSGQLYRWLGDISAAKKHYEEYLRKHPDDVLVQQELAEILSTSPKHFNEALAQFDILLALDPDNHQSRIDKAMLLNKIGRHKESCDELRNIIDVRGDDHFIPSLVHGQTRNVPASLVLAEAFRQANNYADAEAVLNEYLEKHPDDVLVLLDKALVVAKDRERSSEAMSLFDSAIALGKKTGSYSKLAKMSKALYLSSMDKRGQALTLLKELQSAPAPAPKLYMGNKRFLTPDLSIAQIVSETGDLNEAERLLKEATKPGATQKDNLQRLYQLSQILSYQPERRQEALSIITEALRVSPYDPDLQAQKALILLWTGKTDQAIGILEKLVALNPKNYYLRKQLALALRLAHRTDSLYDFFLNLAKERPDDMEVKGGLALLLVESGRYKEAEQLFNEIEGKIENRPEINFALAKLYAETNRIELAKQVCEKGLKNSSEKEKLNVAAEFGTKNSTRFLGLRIVNQLLSENPNNGKALLLLGEMETYDPKTRVSAVEHINQYIAQNPDDIRALQILARCYSWDGDQAKAIETLNRLLAIDANNHSAKLDIARFKTLNKETREEGYSELKRLYEINPVDRQAAFYLAEASIWTGNADKAVPIFTEILKYSPNDKQALVGLATAQINFKPARKSGIRLLRGYLRQNPHDKSVKSLLADALSWSGKHKESISIYKQLVMSSPNELDYLGGLGRVQTQYEPERKDGLANLEKYLTHKPGDHDTKHHYAKMLGLSKEPKKALKLYEEMLENTPEDPKLLVGKAQVLSWNGKMNQSCKSFKQILKKHPKNREAMIGLAQVSNWTGDHLYAEKILKRARELYPHDFEIELESALNFKEMGRIDLAEEWLEKCIEDRKSN